MVLKLKNADIGYQTPLIKGADCSLNSGDIALIIGNNGVGKTTLIKSILNHIPLLNGEIMLDQQELQTLCAKEIALKIAVVFSNAPVPQNFTVTDLISFGKFIHYPYYFQLNKSDIQEVEEITETLNLSQYKDHQLTKLSDGNLQKAFIGRALAQNSPMIILDEPTTHLDEENKLMILNLIRNLAKKQNKLVLFSSHDWRLAKGFADEIWFIHHYKLDAGFTEDVIHRNRGLLNVDERAVHPDFRPPEISAQDFQRDILISALRKNFSSDLSAYKINYTGNSWVISGADFQQNAENIKAIVDVLKILC